MVGTSRPLELRGDMLAWERPWCEPFRELIVHPRLKSYLEAILQKGFRVDGGVEFMATHPGVEGHVLHGGGVERHNFSDAYFFKAGRIYSGMIVAELALADEGPNDGGIGIISASHKANLRCPDRMRLTEAYQEHIRKVPVKAGDVVLFYRNDDPRCAVLAGESSAPHDSHPILSMVHRLPQDEAITGRSRIHGRHDR